MARFSDFRSLAWVAMSLIALNTSCTNDGDLGDLYGKWQLNSMEANTTNEDGETLHYYAEWNYNDNDSYLNFEGEICQMQIANDKRHELTSLWAGFEYTADSLFISVELADYNEGTTGMDGLNAPALLKKHFGMIMPFDEEYEVYRNVLRFGYKLSSEQLILTNDTCAWNFRRYGF